MSLDRQSGSGHERGDVIMVEHSMTIRPWLNARRGSPGTAEGRARSHYVLVNDMRFSARNVEATRAALGYLQVQGPANYLPLHLGLFSLRGSSMASAQSPRRTPRRRPQARDRRGGQRAHTQWMKDAFNLGNSLGMVATPSYLVASDAYVEIMSLAQKRDAIARARG